MIVIFRFFILALTITISLSGIDGNARTYRSWEIAQKSEATKQDQLLEVAVPTSAIVRFKQGQASYTGELIAFNSENLEISVNGFSETVSFSQIKEVKFQGDVWIVTENGTKKRVPIRGISIPLEKVPVTAFKLENSPYQAVIDLKTLKEEEFKRLSGQTNKIHVVKKIVFESPETIIISITTAKRPAN